MKKREMKAEIDRLYAEVQRLQVELYVERVRRDVVRMQPGQPYIWPGYTVTCGSDTVQFSLGG